MPTLAPSEPRTTHRHLAVDLAVAIAIGFVAALAKRYLDFRLGIPGHAGVGWIAALTFGWLINRRPGMSALAGVSMAVSGVPLGLGHSLAYNVVLYGAAGGTLDVLAFVRVPIWRIWGAAAAGAGVHVVKFAVIFAIAWMSGIVKNVEVFGFTAALRNHVIFGAAGGLLGWAVWRGGRDLIDRRTVRRDSAP